MKKGEIFRKLLILVLFLALGVAICVTNVLKMYLASLVVGVSMVTLVCFVLGYIFCEYEIGSKFYFHDTFIEKNREQKLKESENSEEL